MVWPSWRRLLLSVDALFDLFVFSAIGRRAPERFSVRCATSVLVRMVGCRSFFGPCFGDGLDWLVACCSFASGGVDLDGVAAAAPPGFAVQHHGDALTQQPKTCTLNE